MADVLLIIPSSLTGAGHKPFREYLGVGYLASMLKKREIDVDILDCYNYDIKLSETIKFIINTNPKVLGITAPFILDLVMVVKITRKLREKGYTGHISVGGNAAYSCKENLLDMCDIDSIALGESEYTFPELVKSIIEEKINYDMKGFWLRKNKQIYRNETEPLPNNLDQIPFPERGNVFSNKITLLDRGYNVATIITSRGCSFRCKFCTIHPFYNDSGKRLWRGRSPKNVVDEIEFIVKNWGINIFNFADDNFIGNSSKGKERAMQIANEIIKRNLQINFVIETRVDSLDYDLFAQLKIAGMNTVMLGVESGVQRMLDTWQKDTTIDQNKNAIKMLYDLDIKCGIDFIMYDMWSTLDEMEQNYNFIKETGIYKAPEPLGIFKNRLGIFANSPLEYDLKNTGILKLWDFYTIPREDKAIFDALQGLRYYEIQDPQMVEFLQYHHYWVSNLSVKSDYLDEFLYQRVTEKNIPIKECDRWLQMLGYICMKLFKRVLDGVRNKDKNLFQEIDFLIQDYDHKMLGEDFFEVLNSKN